MNRAEIRRKKREEQKQNKTYNITATELESIREQIKKEEQNKAKQIIMDRTEMIAKQIFQMMLVIPVNVLATQYWEKSAGKKMPKFVDECLSLYDAFMDGTVDMKQMEELTEELAGIELVKDKDFYMFADKPERRNIISE